MGRGSSKAGGGSAGKSISGKPFNANDWKTWTVGTKVTYHWEDGGTTPGIVKEIHNDHLIVNVPAYSDLWLDDDFKHLFSNARQK